MHRSSALAILVGSALVGSAVLAQESGAPESGFESAPEVQTPELVEPKPEPEPLVATTDYVGDEVCATCHAGLLPPYEATIHAKVLGGDSARAAPGGHGCESCHGPGGAHLAAGGGKASGAMLHLRPDGSEPVDAQNAVCLECHREPERRYWEGSSHASTDVSCTTCHTVMKAVSRKGLLSAETELETCAGCHPVSRSQMWMNAHMPVREGSMSCASCHNSHGTIADALITDHTVNDNCYRCHGEKRGPFLWEHSPVYEDCLNCHLAHGSTREAMLKLSVPRLCQQCHVGGHGGNPRNPEHRFVVGSSCLQCHPTIHGSNHPSGIGFAR